MPLAPRSAELFEALLALPAGNLRATLSQAADLISAATGADKVDTFLYDPARDSLVAEGVSTQPLSVKQRKLGLDVLQLSNGGRTVEAFRTGRTFHSGTLHEDVQEVRGIREALGVRSTIAVALDVGGDRRGVILVASARPDYFSEEDRRFLESISRWVGVVAHRAELIEEFERTALEAGRRAGAEEIISVLAHDMRNYLAPLNHRVEWLRLRAESTGAREDVLQIELMRQSLSRLRGLVEDMLDVARIDNGLFVMNAELVDVGALVQDCAGLLASQGEVIVRLEPGESFVVPADANRLRQCVENLITNALHVSPSGVPVNVVVSREPRVNGSGSWARVEVLDEGPGVPTDILPRIFDRFATGSPREGGLGLGLYLAKRVAAMHGGELLVESRPGKGTRFVLCLPVPENATT